MQADEQGVKTGMGQPGKSVLSTTTDNQRASLPEGSGHQCECLSVTPLKSGSPRVYPPLPTCW